MHRSGQRHWCRLHHAADGLGTGLTALRERLERIFGGRAPAPHTKPEAM